MRQRQRDTELTSIHVRLPSNQSVGLGRALACRNREVRSGRGKVTCEAREARRPRGFGADGRPCAAGDGCDGERIIIGRRDGKRNGEEFWRGRRKDLGTESKRKRWVTDDTATLLGGGVTGGKAPWGLGVAARPTSFFSIKTISEDYGKPPTTIHHTSQSSVRVRYHVSPSPSFGERMDGMAGAGTCLTWHRDSSVLPALFPLLLLSLYALCISFSVSIGISWHPLPAIGARTLRTGTRSLYWPDALPQIKT